MCGIFCYCSRKFDMDVLIQEFMKIHHRGPNNLVSPHVVGEDKEGRSVLFGFHRLSINGMSSSSNQPLKNDRAVVICNGEIYNHRELAEKYDIECETDSDCEIILHLYLKVGLLETAKLLRGVFAFIIYDKLTNQVHFGRDPIGVRPMFISYDSENDSVAIASEAKSIVKLGKMVRQFPRGSVGTLTTGNTIKTESYYNLEIPAAQLNDDLDRIIIAKRVREILSEAVKIRATMSDRPVGVFLSGGLDSTVIAYEAKKHIPNLHSFAIGLEDSQDLAVARKAAEAIGTKHTEVTFTVEEGIKALDRLSNALESVDITTHRAALPMMLLSEYISKHTDIIVLLSGEGADELFSGYMENHNAPTPIALHRHAIKRMDELMYYDIIRCDRTTAASSLEVRVPMLDRELVSYVLEKVPPEFRDPKLNENIEKWLLRTAYSGDIPDDILWRPKEAFSDGVGYNWVGELKKTAAREVSDDIFERRSAIWPDFVPPSKEAIYLRLIYDRRYSSMPKPIPSYWMPEWSEHGGDPSATVLKVHKNRLGLTVDQKTKRLDYLAWNDTYMGTAMLWAMRSKDPNTQVGACIADEENKVVAVGYNGMPVGCSDDDFPWAREGPSLETKYPYVCHAERNAMNNADRSNLKGCRLYVTMFPCNECAKDIIQKGIRKLYYIEDKYAETNSSKASWRMFRASGVEVIQHKLSSEITLSV